MTEYHLAWLDLISTRDDFYMLLALLVGSAAVWYRLAPGRLLPVFSAAGLVLVCSLVGWGMLL